MSERLDAEEASKLLKTDPSTVQQLWEEGIFQSAREDGAWFTTRELLEGDIETLTETARIHRLRQGGAPLPTDPEAHAEFPWLSLDWVEAALNRLRSEAA